MKILKSKKMVTIAPRYFLPFLLLWLLNVESLDAALSSFNSYLWCSSLPNNTMLKDPNSCNKYITCVDQKPIEGTCEKNLFFDLNTQSCVEPSKTKCLSTDPCAATAGVNGFVDDPYTCNGYYYCFNGKGIHGVCPLNMNFNPDTKTCISNLPCDNKTLPDDDCNILPKGVYMKVPSSCIDYKVCYDGELITGSCPYPYYFNALQSACEKSENNECEIASKPEDPIVILCDEIGVLVSDGDSCDGYYNCQDSFVPWTEHNTCPIGTFFDPDNGGACVARTDTKCTYNRCANLGYGKLEFANIYDDGCTGYHICQDGEVIGDSECPSGYYFDELQQRCTTEKVSYVACASSEPEEGDVTNSNIHNTNPR